MLNFAIFLGIAIYLGGDAVNGKRQNGHFYLYGVRTVNGNKIYTEVSRPVYDYSKFHVLATMASWPFVMAAAYIRNRLNPRRKVAA